MEDLGRSVNPEIIASATPELRQLLGLICVILNCLKMLKREMQKASNAERL